MALTRTVVAIAALLAAPLASAVTYVDIPVTNARDHAFDPAGNLYITAGNQLLRYDLEQCTLSSRVLGTSLWGVDVSGDGRYTAVADRGLIGQQAHVYIYDTQGSRIPQRVDYPAQSLESGSFMVAWAGNTRLYISGSFAGSGWVPLRRFDTLTQTISTVRTVTQNTMLAASGDGQRLALAESNISSGPVRVLDAASGVQLAGIDTNRYGFEVAIDDTGTRIVSPSYYGAYVYNVAGANLVQAGVIGQYADNGPLSVVFSPDSSLIVTASYSWDTPSLAGVRIYDAATRAHVLTLDPYVWSWAGNHALTSARLTISADGRWLAATQSGRVRLYDVTAELGLGEANGEASCATQSIVPRRVPAMGTDSRVRARPFDGDGNPLRSTRG